jgi:hypothetical protein
MAIRASIQADSEDECVEGLERLVAAGFVPTMLPRFLTDGRWMARAVPAPAQMSAPAVGDSRGTVA